MPFTVRVYTRNKGSKRVDVGGVCRTLPEAATVVSIDHVADHVAATAVSIEQEAAEEPSTESARRYQEGSVEWVSGIPNIAC
jgi:hypothetical protein